MDILERIVDWNKERRLLDSFSADAEYNMLREELEEFIEAKDENEMIDALCDIVVVATGAIAKLGYDPVRAMDETIKEISSRRGSFNENTGKWEKDKNQPKDTLYKANYEQARL